MQIEKNVFASAILLALLTVPASAASDGTTSAALPDGQFVIRGVPGSAIHTHGGAPAQLGHARFVFENHGRTARKIAVRDIEYLTGVKDCEHPPGKVTAHPRSGGILLEDGKQRESAPQVTVPAGATLPATVGFTAVPAYYVYCDRFAFRVHFLVDGVRVSVTDEVSVSREEPLRE